MKIYVASSWRNPIYPNVVVALREAGHEVYDFRNPDQNNDTGFHWTQIDPAWQRWDKEEYRRNLSNEKVVAAFNSDMDAMRWADTFVGVQPFGRSASMEMGWAAGQGKRTILLLQDGEPELMVKMFTDICCSMEEVLMCL